MALLALLSMAVGCGDDEKEPTTDTGTADTGSDTGSGSGSDTGTTDTGTSDTGETDTTVAGNTKIRVFHASDLANTASEAGVDIYTGDTLVVDALVYRFGTGFLEVPAGDYAFNVFGDGAGPPSPRSPTRPMRPTPSWPTTTTARLRRSVSTSRPPPSVPVTSVCAPSTLPASCLRSTSGM